MIHAVGFLCCKMLYTLSSFQMVPYTLVLPPSMALFSRGLRGLVALDARQRCQAPAAAEEERREIRGRREGDHDHVDGTDMGNRGVLRDVHLGGRVSGVFRCVFRSV